MKTRSLLLIGLFSFIVFVLVSAPVAVVWPRLAASQPALELAGLSGTVFDGTASAVSLQGRPLARPLHWRFRPLSLLTAKLGFHVDGALDGLNFDGRVAKSLGGDIAVDGMQASGGLKSLLNLSGDTFLPVDGEVAIDLDTLRLAGNFPKRLNGEIRIGNVRWTLTKEAQALGDFTILLSTEAEVIVARVMPTAGPLDVGGEIRVMADRSYEVDLKVKAKPDATQGIQNLVRTLGEADTEGYFRIKTRAQF